MCDPNHLLYAFVFIFMSKMIAWMKIHFKLLTLTSMRFLILVHEKLSIHEGFIYYNKSEESNCKNYTNWLCNIKFLEINEEKN